MSCVSASMDTSVEGNSNHRLDTAPGEAIESTVRSWRRLLIQASTLETVFLKGVSENEKRAFQNKGHENGRQSPRPSKGNQAKSSHYVFFKKKAAYESKKTPLRR